MIAPFAALAEKALSTYVQMFLALLAAGGTLNLSTGRAAAIAAIPAALTVVANGVPVVANNLPFLVDIGLRTVRTFVVTFLGFLVAEPVFRLDRSVLTAAQIAAITAAMAVVKGAVAGRTGRQGSAALLPASLDPVAPPGA